MTVSGLLASLFVFSPQEAFASTCTITGTAGNDTLQGTAGDDVICGGGGDDTIHGLAGNDAVLGGAGNDALFGGDGNDSIDGGDGNDTINAGAGNDNVTGGIGVDTITGGVGDDTLSGGNENDAIDGGDGSDSITAGTGDDAVIGGLGADAIDAGDGADTIDAGPGDDIALGGDGADIIDGAAGKDTLRGGNGNDTINAGPDNDTVYGDAGEDRVSGGDHNDTIDGGPDNDRLVGDAGDDLITGTSGNDFLDGGSGNDRLDGGVGVDSVTGGDGTDTVIGGFGNDTLDGGAGDDQLDGGGENDTMLGGFGQDSLVGGWGNDTLNGGPGPDALDGSGGTDNCDGSTGANTFLNCETQTQDSSPDPGQEPDPDPTPDPDPLPEPDPTTWVDTDQDLMPDDVEIRFGSDPLLADTDGDGLTDENEFLALTDPATVDTDNDSVSDFAEDADLDESTNGDEVAIGTNPIVPDTDGDGLLDGDEAARGTDPLQPDTDQDTLTDGDEVAAGLDPLVADSDGDGVIDAEVVVSRSLSAAETNVSVILSGPASVVAAATIGVPETVQFDDLAGLVAPAVEVIAEAGVSGTLTIPFDTEGLSASPNLGIVHFDEETQTFDRPEQQIVDYEEGSATVTTSDFSPFFLVDRDVFDGEMYTEVRTPQDTRPYGFYRPADVVLAFATADSMTISDPGDLVKPAVRDFIDQLPPDSRVSVMNFDARVTLEPTPDRETAKAAIDSLDSSEQFPEAPCDRPASVVSPTHLWCMMRTAFAIADDGGSDIPSRQKIVVVLDDGSVPRPDDGSCCNVVPIYGAAHSGHLVYGVSMGPDRNETTWQAASQQESGFWFDRPAPSIENDLSGVLGDIASEINARNVTADRDGDGILDYLELIGFATSFGQKMSTDMMSADTDGDGLTDGEELGELIEVEFTDNGYGGLSFKPTSDPRKADTDLDGIGDGQERDLETNARLRDSDGDDLNDLDEIGLGFDPTMNDADGDSFWDDKELADGSDPFGFNFDALGHTHAAFAGLAFGDAWDTDLARALNVTTNVASNGWYLVGQLASGYLVLGDIRDLVYGVGAGDLFNAGAALIGVVPVIGDAARTGATVTKFAAKSPSATRAAVSIATSLPTNTREVTLRLLARSPLARNSLDQAAIPTPPRANYDVDNPPNPPVRIGRDAAQAARLSDTLDALVLLGSRVSDVRVNQQQVNFAGIRVGINRPDLQYTLDGRRYYVEYDRPRCNDGSTSRRGDLHAHRIRANDPGIDFAIQVILVVVGDRCE